jgi:arylsulfatase A-like enzyme
MTQHEAATMKTLLWSGSRRLFLLAAVGALTGAGWAAGMVYLSGSLSVGSSEVLLSAIRNQAWRTGLIYAVVGAALALATILLQKTLPRVAAALSPSGLIALSRNERLGPWPYLLIQFAGLGVMAVSFLVGVQGRSVIIAALVGAVGACLLLLVLRKLARRFDGRHDAILEGILAGVFGGVFYFALFFYAMNARIPGLKFKVQKLAASQELVPFVAALLCCTAATALLVSIQTTRTARLRASTRAGLPIGIPAALVLAAVLLLQVLAPAVPAPSFVPRNPKNIVLIGIDTLRIDHVNLRAPVVDETGRNLTPNLRGLAGRGVVFEKAISQSSWTLPSFGSILTGKYPHEHGAYPLLGELKGRQTTLAEVLREAGYRTGGVVSHFVIGKRRGFHQGFDYFDDSLGVDYRCVTSDRVTDKAIDFLEKESDKPFFLFAHYFDPHYAYRDHEKWDFADSYHGWRKSDPHDYNAMQTQRHFLNGDDLKYIKDLYDEEIAYTDEQIGRLIDRIVELGLEGETAVIIVADHGEEFMERGWIGHTLSLYDELIHVPLVAVLPGLENESPVVAEPVETRAIFTTLLDYVGIDYNEVDRTRSLLPLIRPRPPEAPPLQPQDVFSVVWLPDAVWGSGKQVQMMAVRSGKWKLILDRTCLRTLLFDIEQDPGETTNVLADFPDEHKKLLKKLREWGEELLNEARSDRSGGSLDGSDEIDLLKQTGYI